MRCGRVSVKGEAEEIVVSPKTSSRQKHGKSQRLNPYSTSGLDKFASVNAELSAKRKYVANKTGVPEAMVKFVSSKNGWVPVVIGAKDQGTEKKSNGGDASRVSILGPAEINNGEKGWESRKKDERNGINGESEKRYVTVSAPTSLVRAHGDPTDLWVTDSMQAVNLENIDPGHKQNQHPHHHCHSEPKMFRRFVPMDNCPSTGPATPVVGSDSFYMKTRPAVTYDDSIYAFTVIISMLFGFVFYGRLFVMLLTCAFLYLVPIFREGSEVKGMIRIDNNDRMEHLQPSHTRKMVDHGWIGKMKV